MEVKCKGEIWIYMKNSLPPLRNTIYGEQMRLLKKPFSVKPQEGWLV